MKITINPWAGRTIRKLAVIVGMITMTTTAKANDNLVLAHHIHGQGTEKVMFLHSWLSDARSMDTVKPFLDTETFTYAFPDLRGYGHSKNETGEYSSTEAATDMFRIADALGWNRFHLIGHSMSGMIVQRAALIDHVSGQNRIKSVIGVSPVTANGFPADEDTKAFLANVIHSVENTHHLVDQVMTAGRLPRKAVSLVVANNISTSSPNAMKGYFDMWIDEDFSADVFDAQIQTPVLAIAGAHDNPGFGLTLYNKTFAEWYPNVEVIEFSGAGHLAMLETPLQLVRTIEDFMTANP